MLLLLFFAVLGGVFINIAGFRDLEIKIDELRRRMPRK